MNVTVELRPEGHKLYAQARFETPQGDLVVDHLYVKVKPGIARPRVDMPGRPIGGGMWAPILRLPDDWYTALLNAVEAALA